MLDKVWIFGAGETGRLFNKYISLNANVIGHVVSDHYSDDFPSALSYSKWLDIYKPDEYVIIAFSGAELSRKADLYEALKGLGCKFYTYISPEVFVDNEATIGEGSFIFERNVIQSCVSIGNNTILWSGNHVGHRSTIGSHCFIASHVVICGDVVIGDKCFLGVNSAVAPMVHIGPEAFIGMGVNITRDVDAKERIKGIDTRDVLKLLHKTIHTRISNRLE